MGIENFWGVALLADHLLVALPGGMFLCRSLEGDEL